MAGTQPFRPVSDVISAISDSSALGHDRPQQLYHHVSPLRPDSGRWLPVSFGLFLAGSDLVGPSSCLDSSTLVLQHGRTLPSSLPKAPSLLPFGSGSAPTPPYDGPSFIPAAFSFQLCPSLLRILQTSPRLLGSHFGRFQTDPIPASPVSVSISFPVDTSFSCVGLPPLASASAFRLGLPPLVSASASRRSRRLRPSVLASRRSRRPSASASASHS